MMPFQKHGIKRTVFFLSTMRTTSVATFSSSLFVRDVVCDCQALRMCLDGDRFPMTVGE
jgi:hypothetical protein